MKGTTCCNVFAIGLTLRRFIRPKCILALNSSSMQATNFLTKLADESRLHYPWTRSLMCRSVYSVMKGCSTFLSSLCVSGKQYRSTTTITVYKHRKNKSFVTSFRATARAHCSWFFVRLFRLKKSANKREPYARTILQKRRGNHGQFSNFDFCYLFHF